MFHFVSYNMYCEVYNNNCVQSINNEFTRLKDCCYLEHAGTTLYSEKQLSNIVKELTENTYGNPHSHSTTSKLTGDLIDQARYDVLKFFGANPNEYSVIFTSGATGALKLVAESFDYGQDQGLLMHLEDNHTSVLGMRNLAPHAQAISHGNAYKILSKGRINNNMDQPSNKNSLFVYPAQCNFSGTKYPLSWIDNVQTGVLREESNCPNANWYCLLDAASFAATNHLNLSKYKPDFVVISFYKIFGYPTGLGALLVKNSSSSVLTKRYYGGGTVLMAISAQNLAIPRKILHERFEDGTLPFLAILALRHGFETLQRLSLTMELISKHTFALAKYVYQCLRELKHSNGSCATILYHDNEFEDVGLQGGIVNFNLLRDDGSYVGYAEVMHVANLHEIQLRTGCFCNPGACQRLLKLTPEDVKFHFESGHVCGDQHDIINGTPTGSVRISFGYMSSKEDADYFLNIITQNFVTQRKIRATSLKENDLNVHAVNGANNLQGIVENIYIYPIKSCAAYEIENKWDLVKTGLKYDREWMIVTESGVCFSQKHDARLCLLIPVVNMAEHVLELQFPDMPNISVPLSILENDKFHTQTLCHSKVCGDRIQAFDCGKEISNWLSKAFNKSGLKLLRMCTNAEDSRTSLKQGVKPQLSLTNKAQFLLINSASVQMLFESMPSEEFPNVQDLIDRFRANLVVKLNESFVENSLTELTIGNNLFKVEGPCPRCHVICINQNNGVKTKEPLKTIAEKMDGKLLFGIYLSLVPNANISSIERNQIVCCKYKQ